MGTEINRMGGYNGRKWAKLLGDLKDVYTEIYDLERRRVEINKVVNVKRKRLNALLNYLRMEGGQK